MPRITKNDNYIVYRRTNIINEKVYTGITPAGITTCSGSNGKNYATNTLTGVIYSAS